MQVPVQLEVGQHGEDVLDIDHAASVDVLGTSVLEHQMLSSVATGVALPSGSRWVLDVAVRTPPCHPWSVGQ